MRYLHAMLRVNDLEKAIDFFCGVLGMIELRRRDSKNGRYTLVFLATPEDAERAQIYQSPTIELTYNWDTEEYTGGRNFGHLAFEVDDVYATCQKLIDAGVTINRPPKDGRMAFVKTPDGISLELLQKGESLHPCEPWISMENAGSW